MIDDTHLMPIHVIGCFGILAAVVLLIIGLILKMFGLLLINWTTLLLAFPILGVIILCIKGLISFLK